MTEAPNITSNAAVVLLTDKLKRTEGSLRFINADIEAGLANVLKMCTEKAMLEVHIESLKDALTKCQKQ